MKTLIISLSLVLILLLAGCKDNSTQSLNNSVIKPLKYGNYWIFSRIEYNTDGDSLIKESYKHVILGDTTIDGKKLFFARNFKPDDTTYNDTIIKIVQATLRYYYNDTAGLHIFYLHIDMLEIWTEESLFIKYPVNSNVTYNTELWGDVRVESINESVKVPAGTFKCYKYVLEQGDAGVKEREYYYYAPDIGCIKYVSTVEIENKGEKLFVKEELISYKLN